MRRISLLALMLMCIGFNLNAQVPNYKTVIASTNLNILYLGIDNPVSIAVVGIDDSKISAEIFSCQFNTTRALRLPPVTP